MGGGSMRLAAALLALVLTVAGSATAYAAAQQLRRNHYAGLCPNVETIVRGVMARKVQQTPTTIGATVRLFFHDCFVEGCDASVIVASAPRRGTRTTRRRRTTPTTCPSPATASTP
ncbi:unnamed protein product [Urochloa humidicola]